MRSWVLDVNKQQASYAKFVLISPLAGSTPTVLGFGALTAVILGAYDYAGGALTGYKKDPEIDEFDRKEYLRKNRRRPIEETINDLGEGRGKLHSAALCML